VAGDLDLQERVVLLVPPTDEAAADAALAPLGDAPIRLHAYGRLSIVALPEGREERADAALDVAAEVPDEGDLDDLERLGLAAFRLRESDEYQEAKRNRPREGESWDHEGCQQFGIPGRAVETGLGAAWVGAAPGGSFLEGSVAVGLVLVDGPTADLQFSATERAKVVAEVQNGLSWWAMTNPAADLSFVYDIQTPAIRTAADPNAADLEALWRDPTMQRLGYTADWNGVVAYVDAIRRANGTRWAYCAFFVKYPLSWFAYTNIDSPRLVMQYDNDGWGPDNIDRVFAHETGHVFRAPDEYTSSSCDCAGSWGRFGQPNGNCEICAPGGGVACIMKGNTWSLCRWTPSHVGWGRGVAGNPSLRQSRFGRQGNFEVVVASQFSGLEHIWRNNDAPGMPWSDPSLFSPNVGHVDAVTMIQSNYGSPGNLEVVARVGDTLQFFWRDSGPAFRWNGPSQIASRAAGTPALIQSKFGRQGNFELVYPLATGGLGFMWRNNDAPGMPWSAPATFGTDIGVAQAVTIIQSNYGSPGNLELIARAGDFLHFFWRDSGPAFRWNGPIRIADGAAGNPALIQSRFGRQGNFELVYPLASGGLGFMWRNNDAPNMPWSSAIPFAQSLGVVDGVTMIQSNYGVPGNLEVIADAANRLQFLWRDSGPAFRWNGPWRIL
jgi:hypothetical protein